MSELLDAPGHAIPLDWGEYGEHAQLVRQVADAALRETGGCIDSTTKTIHATSPGQSQRAFRLGLQAAGVAYEVLDYSTYMRRLDAEWDGARYIVRPVRKAAS